ncbi:MAG: hypothetical protein U1F51_04000 [Burkholderiales bacterium]
MTNSNSNPPPPSRFERLRRLLETAFVIVALGGMLVFLAAPLLTGPR